jgi:CubicO group peptidase (beta-lactamase class C family)
VQPNINTIGASRSRLAVLGFVYGLGSIAALCGSSGAAHAQALKADPVGAGLDPAKLAALKPELQKFVDSKQIAGAVALIGRRGRIGSLETVGFADVAKQTPMRPDTVFRIASMTKIATAVAIMMLEDEGKLSVSDPVEKLLPEFRGLKLITKKTEDKDGLTVTLVDTPTKPTIEHLLTHTSGMQCGPPAGFAELYGKKNRTLDEGVVAFSQHPLISPPGTVWKYCSTAIDTLGRIIEVASGKPYDVFMNERLFKPLGMKDTSYKPSKQLRARTATLYKKDGPAEGAGTIVASDDTGPPDPIIYPSPSGGLWSTAPDYAKLMQMLLDGGTAHGKRFLKADTLAKMASVHFSSKEKVGFSPGLGMGLGVQVVMTPTQVTTELAPGSYGHGGAYGTQAWVDPKNQVFYVLMVQRQGFGNGDQADVRRTLQRIGSEALLAPTAAAPAAKPSLTAGQRP